MNTSAKSRFEILRKLRWTARALSLLSILLLLMFIAGEKLEISRILPEEWLGILFFPVGLVAGFVIGWKNELLGGIVSVLSLAAFYYVYGAMVSGAIPNGPGFIILSFPAVLFLAAGLYAAIAIGRPKRTSTVSE